MNYTDPIFLFVFLPIIIAIYNLVPQKHRWKVLLISSYLFFWSISGKLIIYILATTGIMYGCGLKLNKEQEKRNNALKNLEKAQKKEIKEKFLKKQRLIVTIASLILLGILILLKYSKFIGTNINNLFEVLNIPLKLGIPKFIMPIGISF